MPHMSTRKNTQGSRTSGKNRGNSGGHIIKSGMGNTSGKIPQPGSPAGRGVRGKGSAKRA